jgi:hypothetical protein
LSLSACQGARKTFGFEKSIPDEFRVISNQPLNVPPDFNLRPPEKVAEEKKSVDTREIRETLIGDTVEDTSKEKISKGENIFLKKAKTYEADPNIKQELEQQRKARSIEEDEKSLWDKLTGESEDKDPVVDSLKERERIIESEKEGKAPAEGEVPTIEQKKSRNILKRIFDW